MKLATCRRIVRSRNCRQAKGAHAFRYGSQRKAASLGKALLLLLLRRRENKIPLLGGRHGKVGTRKIVKSR